MGTGYQNKTITELLDNNEITQDEYDILFSEKKELDILTKHVNFMDILRKTIKLQEENSILDLSYVKFPTLSFATFIKNSQQAITFENAQFFGQTDFYEMNFHAKINFCYSKFFGETHFVNTNFYSELDFCKTIFFNNVYFSNIEFHTSADFSGLTCNKVFLLIGISFNKIDLKGISANETNFFDLFGLNKKQKVTPTKKHFDNKDTAIFIKSHFEKQNNISESNKYFAIEQELYIDELETKNPPDTNKYKNLFVLYLNKIVSNFGTDWIRPLLVMFIFGFFASLSYGFFQTGDENINFTNSKLWLFAGLLYSLLVYYFYHKKLWVALIASIIIFFSILMGDIHLREISNDISKLINPLNIFKPKANYFENIAMYGMLVKLGMSVLIYQFIMAFRQNTRRK